MPAAPEVEIRPAREGDVEAIVALLRLCLGPGSVPRTAEFWRWKHERSPFGPSPVLLAEAGGELVGLRAFLRWRLASGDRAVEAVRAVDTATHPAWRGRGIFSRLTTELAERERARGTALVFNTPNRSSGPGYRKMGWVRVGRVPLLVRPVRWSSPLRASRPGPEAAGPDLAALAPVEDFLRLPWLDRFMEAVEATRGDRRYRTPLDRAYLDWRYRAIPGVEYRALWSGEGPEAAAVLVRGRRRGRFREVVVSEVLAPPGAAGAAAGLLGRLAAGTGADYLALAAARATPERAAALRAGFVPAPGVGPALFVREWAMAPGLPEPAMRASWNLGTGTLEIF